MSDSKYNTGNRNTGNWNAGDRNTGHFNTGNRNTGDRNTGNRNTGNFNTGNWNTGHRNTGHFNTTDSQLRLFNKFTDVRSSEIYYPSWLFFNLTEWVYSDDMTDEEKVVHPEHETCGGYLRVHDYKEAAQRSYNAATKAEQDAIEDIPNYCPHVLYEIFGIDRRPKQEDSRDEVTQRIKQLEYELNELKSKLK